MLCDRFAQRAWWLALLAAFAATSCFGGSGNGSGLSEESRDALDRGLAEIEPQLEFKILRPSYLPEGIDPEPASYSLSGREATVIFSVIPGETLPPEIPVAIQIMESLDAVGPKEADPHTRAEEAEVAGRRVVIQRHPESPSIAIYWEQEPVNVGLQLVWETPSPKLTPEMEEEAFRVAKSMIDQ